MTSTKSEDIPSPAWLDRKIFPFRHRRVDVGGHKIHYIDEGQGPTLLLLHGNGSWSYGFRHAVPELSKHFRVVAPDYPGFGLSTAAPGYSFKPADQSAVVELFVDALQLKDIRLFVEDWGGPLGLGMAGRRPELIHSLVISNTWAWPAQGIAGLEKFSKLAGGGIGRFLILRFNLLEKFGVPNIIAREMTASEKQGYYMPYPTVESRIPQTIFPREILASRSYLAEVEASLERLKEKPVLLIWGLKDPGFSEDERVRFLDHFPRASVLILPDAKHFVLVDEADRSTAAIVEFETYQGTH